MDERVRDVIANVLEDARDAEDAAALSAAYDEVFSRLRKRLGEVLDVSPELVEEIITAISDDE